MIFRRLWTLAAIIGVIGAGVRLALLAQGHVSPEGDVAAIAKLHQLDVDATLSDKADRLADLWDRDGVRLEQGRPAEMGKDTIYANDKRWEAQSKGGHSLSYKPDIKDLQIIGDWAVEWGYFEASSTESDRATPVTVHGKQLRILKRQPNGSWKFARVMSLIDSRQPSK